MRRFAALSTTKRVHHVDVATYIGSNDPGVLRPHALIGNFCAEYRTTSGASCQMKKLYLC